MKYLESFLLLYKKKAMNKNSDHKIKLVDEIDS